MKTKIIGIALIALTAMLGSACGSDSKSTDTPKAGSSGGAGAGGGGAVYCLKELCKKVEGVDAEPCCMDPFAGGCGVKSGGACRVPPAPPDARCPVPNLAKAFMLPGAGGSGSAPVITGCCTANNECGVDSGMGGCQSRTSVCQYIPKAYVSMIEPLSCDGMTLELPADCGTNMSFPGAGAAGSGT
jgi:hypothetical protein